MIPFPNTATNYKQVSKTHPKQNFPCLIKKNNNKIKTMLANGKWEIIFLTVGLIYYGSNIVKLVSTWLISDE